MSTNELKKRDQKTQEAPQNEDKKNANSDNKPVQNANRHGNDNSIPKKTQTFGKQQ